MDKQTELNQFTVQIRRINELESQSSDLFRFCIDACVEIYRHTGNHEWEDKLARLVSSHAK